VDGLEPASPLSVAYVAWSAGHPRTAGFGPALALYGGHGPGGGEIPGPAPAPCITQIRLSCAPELNGRPGSDLLAEVSYRLLLNSEKNCATKAMPGT
jgi:hypothetical protein